MFKTVKRKWCELMHEDLMFAGGALAECRKCGEKFENPALNGPIKNLTKPWSVRPVLVDAGCTPEEIKAYEGVYAYKS
jgi:hypothetical protein